MRKIAIILFIVLVAVSAMAREATLTKTPLNVNGVSKAEGDCVVGNTDFDNIQGYYGDWWWGFESYAYLVNPLQEGCACDIEFALSAVHMLLALDTDTNLLVQAALYSAVGEGDCFVPGEELYGYPSVSAEASAGRTGPVPARERAVLHRLPVPGRRRHVGRLAGRLYAPVLRELQRLGLGLERSRRCRQLRG